MSSATRIPLPFLFVAVACSGQHEAGDRGRLETARIFAVGDSILAWNLESGDSIPQRVGSELDLDVYNAGVSGAQLLSDEPISNQYTDGDWDWVLLNGGGNDLNNLCGCGQCDEVMDNLLSTDGSGATAELAALVTASGAQAVILGYYEVPETGQYNFPRCNAVLANLSDRQRAFANTTDGVWFVDARDTVQADKLEMYDDDHVHPSKVGAAALGQQIADTIRAVP